MRLSQTDKSALINAVTPPTGSKVNWRYGRVFACTLEKKRLFNSLCKLQKLGLVEGKIEYQQQNGYQDPHFGRLWNRGASWNEFSGSLTSNGEELAKKLASESSYE